MLLKSSLVSFQIKCIVIIDIHLMHLGEVVHFIFKQWLQAVTWNDQDETINRGNVLTDVTNHAWDLNEEHNGPSNDLFADRFCPNE